MDTLTEVIEAFDQQEQTHRTEGTKGVENLCRLVNAMGYVDRRHIGQFAHNGSYGDLIEFLSDNSGCVEAIRRWIEEQDVAEWKENVESQLNADEDE